MIKNRIKNRDLWDIAWLVQQGVTLPSALIPQKIADHQRTQADFANLLQSRMKSLQTDSSLRDDFLKEMRRFLPADTVSDTLTQPAWWNYLTSVLDDQARLALTEV